MPARQLIPARRLAWLQRELAAWRSEGLVDDAAAGAIAARYEASSRARAARVLVALGAGLVGVGIIWLVASNLDIDEAGPLTRFAFIAALWLGFVALAEVARGRERLGVLAGALALLAAIAYGATIFQVAQSLQVPAHEPWLLAAWSGGALAYAYATGGSGPLVLGVGTAVGCYVWLLTRDADGGVAFVLGLGWRRRSRRPPRSCTPGASASPQRGGWPPGSWRCSRSPARRCPACSRTRRSRRSQSAPAAPRSTWPPIRSPATSCRPARSRTRSSRRAALLCAVAAPRLWPRLTGDEYRLAVAPVDPIDPFRGAYVALRVRGVPTFTDREGTVYVELRRRRDGTYRGSGTRVSKPSRGPFLRCHADGEVRCGIESFFASQTRARRIERELADGATALVRIDGAGRAALVDLEAG